MWATISASSAGSGMVDQHGQLDAPPHVGDEFFDTAELQAAFESWHVGRVLRAYRTHPYFLGIFARPLTLENLGRWLGLNQNQMSRQENGKAEQNLELLQEWPQSSTCLNTCCGSTYLAKADVVRMPCATSL
jgi:hypothetical protein